MDQTRILITREMLHARLIGQLSATPAAEDVTPDYSRSDLLALPTDEMFVIEAFRRILGRKAEIEALHHYTAVLKVHSRQTVIDTLMAAKQGMAGDQGQPQSETMPGPVSPEYSGGAPVDQGQLQGEANALDDLTPLDLLESSDDFVREAYRRILGRDPESAGLRHYRNLLGLGITKEQILGILAASDEGRMRNLNFLWHGSALSKKTLGLHRRLQILFWKITGLYRLQDAVSTLRAQTAAAQACNDAIQTEVQGISAQFQDVSTRVADAQNEAARSIEEWRDILGRHEAIALRLVEESANTAQVIAKVSGVTYRIVEKLDEIASDVRIREDAILEGQQRGGFDLAQGLATLRNRTETLAAMIRPPVLAGTDVFVTKVNDFLLAVPRDDLSLAASYAYWGTIDIGLSRCLGALLKPGMIFVDIGANIGIHSLEAARAVGSSGKVYSFEPSPRTFAVLRRNLEMNGFTSVELFPFAVLDRCGRAPLYLKEGASPLNSIFPEIGAEKSIMVEAITLDEALRGREHADIIKIDAEGAEPLILRGMTNVLAKNPGAILIIEFAPVHLAKADVSPAGLLAEFRAAGFEIRRIDDFTGELSAIMDDEIMARESSNLYLQRHQEPGDGRLNN